MIYYVQISRAVGSRAPRDRTVVWSPRARRHPADMGSVARKPENFACKNAQKGNCPKMQFASFGVSFRALSGASRDASEEVSFSASPMSEKERKLPGKQGTPPFVSASRMADLGKQ